MDRKIKTKQNRVSARVRTVHAPQRTIAEKSSTFTLDADNGDDCAIDLLNMVGARQFIFNNKFTIGLWNTKDKYIQDAIYTLYRRREIKPHVVSLEGKQIPTRYKEEF